MKIKFLGAASTVTGSKHLLQVGNKNFLIDCGQLQGPEAQIDQEHAFKNEMIATIDSVFITHAHIDHCGYLPYIVRKGFQGVIYTNIETYELMKISLEDSANLLRESVATDKRKEQFFFDKNDVHTMLTRVKLIEEEIVEKLGDIEFSFHRAGHILGASFIKFKHNGKSITFSGDIGRMESVMHLPPNSLGDTDCLVLESTYGDRLHTQINLEDYFLDLFNEVIKKGSTLIIPAFSIDRTQMILSLMTKVIEENDLRLPVILTGAMGLQVTKVYEKFQDNLKINQSDFSRIHKYVREIFYQNELNHFWETAEGAKVVIAGGGMLSGGTILGHLKKFAIYENNIVLITGYQASDTLGRQLLDGEKNVVIEKVEYEIKADVRFLGGLSAHGDQGDILNWIKTSKSPQTIFLVHGEKSSRLGLKDFLSTHLEAKIILPVEGQVYSLNGDLG